MCWLIHGVINNLLNKYLWYIVDFGDGTWFCYIKTAREGTAKKKKQQLLIFLGTVLVRIIFHYLLFQIFSFLFRATTTCIVNASRLLWFENWRSGKLLFSALNRKCTSQIFKNKSFRSWLLPNYHHVQIDRQTQPIITPKKSSIVKDTTTQETMSTSILPLVTTAGYFRLSLYRC